MCTSNLVPVKVEIVQFADPKFETWMVSRYDENKDGKIQISEIPSDFEFNEQDMFDEFNFDDCSILYPENIDSIKLYIAGDGPCKEEIEKYINGNNLKEKIILLGYLKQDDLKEYTRNASFTVVPSIWYENCPYSILETQAIGKAIIGANIGGIPELVQNEENGLVYKYDDVNELKEKMKKLFNDKELANEFGENAKKYATKEYDKDKYYEKIINIYKNSVIKGD